MSQSADLKEGATDELAVGRSLACHNTAQLNPVRLWPWSIQVVKQRTRQTICGCQDEFEIAVHNVLVVVMR